MRFNKSMLPLKLGPHRREPWSISDPREVIVHCNLNQLYGDYRRPKSVAANNRKRYEHAKRHFNMPAAFDIVEECISERGLDELADRLIAARREPIIVVPHPEFDAGAGNETKNVGITNALPIAFARYLADVLGGEVDGEIIQSSRPGRTKLKRFPRLLWQPSFTGAVDTDRAYILADDVCTLCGTLAALRSHIIKNGGTVVGVTALAHSSGSNILFPITQHTETTITRVFGPQLADLWLEKVGYVPQALTEGEGSVLLDFATQRCGGLRSDESLQRLRDRLLEASAKAE